MVYFWFKTILKWFLSVFFSIEVSEIGKISEDVVEKQRKEINQKFMAVLSLDEIDAKSFERGRIVAQMESDVKFHFQMGSEDSSWQKIPESDKDDFIQFQRTENSLIEHSEKTLIFTGSCMNQKKLSIKKISRIENGKTELKIANKLTHHESFLPYFFTFTQSKIDYIAMDYYKSNLKDFDLKYDLKSFLIQICNGLEFMHKLKIAHLSINFQSIAVVQHSTQTIFKIKNFEKSIETDDVFHHRKDISGLRKVLVDTCKSKWIQIGMRKFSEHDISLLTDLMDWMIHEQPSAKDVKNHPFLMKPREILYFIVEVAKFFESTNPNGFWFCNEVIRNSKRVLVDKWFNYIDQGAFHELERINRKNFPSMANKLILKSNATLKGDLIGLVKTIRNLVGLIKKGLFINDIVL